MSFFTSDVRNRSAPLVRMSSGGIVGTPHWATALVRPASPENTSTKNMPCLGDVGLRPLPRFRPLLDSWVTAPPDGTFPVGASRGRANASLYGILVTFSLDGYEVESLNWCWSGISFDRYLSASSSIWGGEGCAVRARVSPRPSPAADLQRGAWSAPAPARRCFFFLGCAGESARLAGAAWVALGPRPEPLPPPRPAPSPLPLPRPRPFAANRGESW